MARSQSSTVVKVLGAGAAVIAGGAALGYLFGSARLPHPAEQAAQPPVSATLPPAPKLNPSLIHPHLANGNYTAPGAPRIVIEEQRQPVLRRVAPPVPAADPEASQEAAAPKPKSRRTEGVPSDSGTPTSPDISGAPPATETAPDTPDSAASPPPVSPPPAPADPDFERVGAPKPAPAASDPEAGQQGSDKPPAGRAQTESGGRAQFRVQTGAYTDESNARSVADTLRAEGFSASTRSERDGDHLVYKVQVGAYRSKNGASKAADDLQKKGYAAFISPMVP